MGVGEHVRRNCHTNNLGRERDKGHLGGYPFKLPRNVIKAQNVNIQKQVKFLRRSYVVCSSGNVCPTSERSKPATANNFLFELAILIWSISSQSATNKMEK